MQGEASIWERLDLDQKCSVVKAGRILGKSMATIGAELGTTKKAIAGFVGRHLSYDPEVVAAGMENFRRSNEARRKPEPLRLISPKEYDEHILDRTVTFTRDQARAMDREAMKALYRAHPERLSPTIRAQIQAVLG